MASIPVSEEISGALGRFFLGGRGPRHSRLTKVFAAAGYGDVAPYDTDTKTPNKEDRVHATVRAAIRRTGGARDLIDGLLAELRLDGAFTAGGDNYEERNVVAAQQAFRRAGWALSDGGVLSTIGRIDLETGGRAALDEQLERLRSASDDPGQLLGSAKDLLEATAKFVLEEVGNPQDGDFGHLWYLARDRLGILPEQVAATGPASQQIKKVLGASWTIAEQVNALRNAQGAGHGRTLPTGVSPEVALLIVREACSVAQFILSTLDRTLGR